VNLTEAVFQHLQHGPRSGGAIIEQMQVIRDAVLVYGALARLAREGRVERKLEGQAEEVWGLPDAPAPRAPRAAGPPESFRMGGEELAKIERELWELTEDLPRHYFEELRRVVIARADRFAYGGMKTAAAARAAIESLGPPRAARRFLRAVASGGDPALRLRGRRGGRMVAVVAALVAILLLLRSFVVGWYELPAWQVSMAPALVPGLEGGDAYILADLISYRFRDPRRGEIALFEARSEGEQRTYVKRVMGLPGETVAIRGGDVFVNGERLVKERPLLDAVAVPLFGEEGFEGAVDQPGLVQTRKAHTGFRLPDGAVETRREFAGDVIVEATIGVVGLADSIVFLLSAGGQPRHQVVFTASGYESGVFVEGRAVVRGKPCQLEPGRTYDLWMTNADRVFRVELDGKEIARSEIAAEAADPRLEVALTGTGASVADLRLARDLVYTSRAAPGFSIALGQDEYCMLGDNSPVSRDSRVLGGISRDALVGRAWRVVWPLGRARLLGGAE
jgi:signal peptidase I